MSTVSKAFLKGRILKQCEFSPLYVCLGLGACLASHARSHLILSFVVAKLPLVPPVPLKSVHPPISEDSSITDWYIKDLKSDYKKHLNARLCRMNRKLDIIINLHLLIAGTCTAIDPR